MTGANLEGIDIRGPGEILQIFPEPFEGSDTASEGRAAPFVLGTMRVPGQVAWTTDVRHLIVGGGSGGKKSPDIPGSILLFIDVAFIFAHNITEGPNPVREIFIGGEKVYNATVDNDVTSDDISVSTIQQNQTLGQQPDSPTCKDIVQEHLLEFNDSGATISNLFKDFRSGAVVAVTGSIETENNGTFRVTKVEIDSPTVGKSRLTVRKCAFSWDVVEPDPPVGASVCTLVSSCAPGISTSEVSEGSVRFVQDIDDFGSQNLSILSSITQHTGVQTQNPDPLIEGILGIGKTQAFRSFTYVVINNLQITKWGKTLPPAEGVVRENSARTLGDAIKIIAKRAVGITDADLDVTGLTEIVRGFGSGGGLGQPAEALQRLMFVHGLDVHEEASISATGSFDVKLKFFKRAAADVVIIADGDRGAHAFNEEPDARLIGTTQSDPVELISSVTIKYIDSENDYQVGARTYHGETQTEDNNESFDTFMALTPTEAENLARRVFWTRYFEARDVKQLTLPPSYSDITEGDRLTVNDSAGNPTQLRVVELNDGADGLIRLRGHSEFVDLFALTSFGSAGGRGAVKVQLPPEMRMNAVELPCMAPAGDPSKLGVVLGTNPLSSTEQFVSASIFASTDATNYTLVENVRDESFAGVVLGTLAGGVTGTFWDEKNTLTVVLDNDTFEPSSSTDQQVLSGRENWIVVGGKEIVGFVNVAKTADRTFNLTRLLRGRRNTEQWISEHAVGEKVLFIKDGNSIFFELGGAALGKEGTFRSVPLGGSLIDSAEGQVKFEIAGLSVKPFGPTVTTRSRKDPSPGDGTFRIRWRRRTQVPFRMLSGVEPPLHEEGFERYQILIIDAGVVVRTIFIGDRTFYNYSKARQVADFGTEQFSLTFSIYQMAPGHPGLITTATIT